MFHLIFDSENQTGKYLRVKIELQLPDKSIIYYGCIFLVRDTFVIISQFAQIFDLENFEQRVVPTL